MTKVEDTTGISPKQNVEEEKGMAKKVPNAVVNQGGTEDDEEEEEAEGEQEEEHQRDGEEG